MALHILGGVLLLCLGLLLGATWTTQALRHKHSRLAEERRRLNEQLLAVAAPANNAVCPRCAHPLMTGQD